PTSPTRPSPRQKFSRFARPLYYSLGLPPTQTRAKGQALWTPTALPPIHRPVHLTKPAQNKSLCEASMRTPEPDPFEVFKDPSLARSRKISIGILYLILLVLCGFSPPGTAGILLPVLSLILLIFGEKTGALICLYWAGAVWATIAIV